MQQSRWAGLTRMWTDGVIHHGCNPLILLSERRCTTIPDPRARAGEATRRWQPEGQGSISISKHHNHGLQRAFRPINIRWAQLLQLLPYRDGWPARLQSLRSQTTHFPDEADNLFTPYKARCLSKSSRDRRSRDQRWDQRVLVDLRSSWIPSGKFGSTSAADMTVLVQLCLCASTRWRLVLHVCSLSLPRQHPCVVLTFHCMHAVSAGSRDTAWHVATSGTRLPVLLRLLL